MAKINQLESLKVLKAVVEGGSFTAAAKHLEISVARVSKSIERLEIELSTSLFKRSTRYMRVTDDGERCYKSALTLIDQWNDLQQEISDSQSNPTGRLKLSVPMTWGLSVFAPMFTRFMQIYPGIEFDNQLSDKHVNVLEGEYDLVLRLTDHLSDSSLLCQRITSYRYVVCATPEYLSEFGLPIQPEDLEKHACLMYNLEGRAKKWYFKLGSKEKNVFVTPKLVTNNSLLIKTALIGHQGIAYIPDFVVADDISCGKLHTILTDYKTTPLNLFALRTKDRKISFRLKVFIEFLIEHLRNVNL